MKEILKKIYYCFRKTISNTRIMTDFFIAEQIYKFNIFFHKEVQNNSKSIMILIYHLRNGGAERVASNLCDDLIKKYNTILVTIDPISSDDYNCKAKRIVLDSNCSKHFRIISFANQIRKIKKQYNITHSISFCTKMNYLNCISKCKDKTIISIRNYLSLSPKELIPENKYMSQKAGKFADEIVVVSDLLKNDQIKKYNANESKIKTIYNFIDNHKIDNYLEKEKITKKKNTIINIGRLTEQKNQISLINAFVNVIKVIPDAQLIILGKGELEKELYNIIKKNNLEKNVHLYGFEDNPYKYLKMSNIFVLSSSFEGMSNSILEAMYCGLPVISTDCMAGTREIIAPNTDFNYRNTTSTKEKYGILVPVLEKKQDEIIMSKAIIDLLSNNQLIKHYEEMSKIRAKDFLKENILNQWLAILD